MAAEAGYLPHEADHVTVAEILIAFDAHYNNRLFQMRQTRTMAYAAASPYLEHKMSEMQFMPLPGDEIVDHKLSPQEKLVKWREQKQNRIKREAIKKHGQPRT